MREEAGVISISKVIHVLSCGWLLGILGFGTALQAAEKPSSPERMNPGLSAQTDSDRRTPDQHTRQSIETIKGMWCALKANTFTFGSPTAKKGICMPSQPQR
jgi:hypothetical protein